MKRNYIKPISSAILSSIFIKLRHMVMCVQPESRMYFLGQRNIILSFRSLSLFLRLRLSLFLVRSTYWWFVFLLLLLYISL